VRTPAVTTRILVALSLSLAIAAQARDLSLPEVRPETAGFSSERLKRLDAGMKAIVDNKQLSGIATVVVRRGQVVQQLTYGQADVAGNKPMRMDSIVRVYSMTKPITGAAMMMLYEEGKWKPSDPISRHIPEFKDLKVFTGVGTEGYLVEKLSGKPFADFLRDRLFEPLAMKDTAFYVPKEKMSRLANIYSWSEQGLAAMPHDPGVNAPPRMASGGGGLYSTAADYLRFAQMLANEGELEGKRLLAPSTIALMTANHVPDLVKDQNGKFGIGAYRMQPGFGFGYDVAVYEDPLQVGSTAGKGTYLWDGLAGTWFWIDPTNDVVFLGIIQQRGGPAGVPNLEDLSRQLTFQALVDPAK
jgi:CubicO group peptidase (beta-lactamase class C family)